MSEDSVVETSDESLKTLAMRTGKVLSGVGHRLVTAESCTGGGIMKTMTDIPGSSGWCEGGFITYTNRAKQRLLDVPAETLVQQGAVSEEAVRAMAEGALANSDGTLSVAVSGIAGPDGGSVAKPVGTVWLAWAEKEKGIQTECCQFTGDRDAVRRQAIQRALLGVIAMCRN